MMAIAALATPSVMDMIAMSRLRSSTGGLSGLLQATRSTAIKKNQTTSLHFTIAEGRLVAYVKPLLDTSDLNSKDQQEWFGDGFSKTDEPTGGPAKVDPTLLGNLTSDPLRSDDPSFNARGLPCVYDSTSGACQTGPSFIYYFSYNAPVGHVRWAALGITAAGRIKTWYYTGSEWKN
jgi:hypothetical protein